MYKLTIDFNEQKENIEKQLRQGEEIKHCVDASSFGGKFFNPNWVVTNYARVYSLYYKRWLCPAKKYTGKKNRAGNRAGMYFTLGRNINVSRLVANYFCDKTLIDKYGEENVDVHHIRRINPLLSCEDNNKASNLQYVLKAAYKNGDNNVLTHSFATAVQTGTYKAAEDMDVFLKAIINTAAKDSDAEVEIVNDTEYRVLIHAKGTLTEQEAEEYAKKFRKSKETFTYVRADGTTHFGRL
ncbi:MAG: hypothetical protein E7261_04125 [Lachnospiraceae bacterium]|nr:hypothetical protein [Lachnospiraceae bacterium]